MLFFLLIIYCLVQLIIILTKCVPFHKFGAVIIKNKIKNKQRCILITSCNRVAVTLPITDKPRFVILSCNRDQSQSQEMTPFPCCNPFLMMWRIPLMTKSCNLVSKDTTMRRNTTHNAL